MTIIDSQTLMKRTLRNDPGTLCRTGPITLPAAIDGAIFISAFSMYRYDTSYAVEVQRAHPDRFAIVKPVACTAK